MEAKKLFHNFWILFRGYWNSEEKWRARGLLAVVLALGFAAVGFLVEINSWYKEFYDALQNYEEELFLPLIGEFLALALSYIVISVYAVYLRQLLEIRWRKWMTNSYLESWLKNQTYYRLQDSTDNPDQRISEDISQFVTLTLQLITGFLRQIITLVSFGIILWNLSGALDLEIGGTEISIPGYMFWLSLIYATVGTFGVHQVGKKLIGLNFNQQRYEADFRFGMMRIRENSESIAFYRGEESENESLKDKFSYVIKNFRALMTKTKHLNFYVNGYAQLAVIFPFLIAAPRYFRNEIQLGGLMQISSAFGRVQDALSYFVESYDGIANLAAVINRLSGFTAHVEEVQKIESHVEKSNAEIFTVSDLTISLPDGHKLLKNFSGSLKNSESLLVTGASGCGKSTFLRTIAGIWFYASGKISLPENSRVMFLPQNPYVPLGTLRRALIYPSAEINSPPDEKLREVLKEVGLPELIERLDDAEDWTLILSGGEKQRLAFARVLLTAPDYIFLDEATSALDEPREIEMYELLKEKLPGMTIVSVGHRSTLFKIHDTELNFDGKGNWLIRPIVSG